MKNYRSTIVGFAVLTVMLTAGAAQSLAGSNTVFSDDIVDGTITHADVKANSLGGSRLLDNAVTGTKILDGTVKSADMACPSGMTRTGDICFTNPDGQASYFNAFDRCSDTGLRLPSVGEAGLLATTLNDNIARWADAVHVGANGSDAVAVGPQALPILVAAADDSMRYRCVISLGASPGPIGNF